MAGGILNALLHKFRSTGSTLNIQISLNRTSYMIKQVPATALAWLNIKSPDREPALSGGYNHLEFISSLDGEQTGGTS